MPADRARAASHLAAGQANLAAAELITDASIRYKLAYDAGFEAVLAHMSGHGLRLRSRPGHHEAAALYATFVLITDDARSAAEDLDAIRRGRNAVYYQASEVGEETAAWAVDTARALLGAIARPSG